MKTINERAKEVSKINKEYTQEENFVFAGGYIFGATDQREIDIQRACEWLITNGYFLIGHKEIKLFKQYMKGE